MPPHARPDECAGCARYNYARRAGRPWANCRVTGRTSAHRFDRASASAAAAVELSARGNSVQLGSGDHNPRGRVLINLGYGYEQVARNCPYAYGYGCESYGYPIAPMTPIVPTYGPPTYVPPRYAPPAYGAPTYAPTYPNPGYPPDGFYRPTPTPPAAPPGGCPRGYLPTGGNPPCIDPVVVPLPSSSYPASAAAPSPGPGAAPPRLAPYRPSTSNPPTVVRRR